MENRENLKKMCNIENMWKTFLSMAGVTEKGMYPGQRKVMRHTFFTGIAVTMQLLGEIGNLKSEGEQLEFIESLKTQLENTFFRENNMQN